MPEHLACNYDEDALYPDASQCDFETCYGCDDNMACNYDDTALFNDGSCDFETCYGCTNDQACNYDASASFDDDSCDLVSCYVAAPTRRLQRVQFRCRRPRADDGGCDYPLNYPNNSFDCEGNLCRMRMAMVCATSSVAPMKLACNYSPVATEDNGTCVYTRRITTTATAFV